MSETGSGVGDGVGEGVGVEVAVGVGGAVVGVGVGVGGSPEVHLTSATVIATTASRCGSLMSPPPFCAFWTIDWIRVRDFDFHQCDSAMNRELRRCMR